MEHNNTRRTKRKAAMIEALRHTLGNVTDACKMCHVSKQTHYNWLHSDEAYFCAVEDVKGEALDFAEAMLMKAIAGGDTTAIIFYLKTQGKRRGYSERCNVDIGSTLTIDCGFAD